MPEHRDVGRDIEIRCMSCRQNRALLSIEGAARRTCQAGGMGLDARQDSSLGAGKVGEARKAAIWGVARQAVQAVYLYT